MTPDEIDARAEQHAAGELKGIPDLGPLAFVQWPGQQDAWLLREVADALEPEDPMLGRACRRRAGLVLRTSRLTPQLSDTEVTKFSTQVCARALPPAYVEQRLQEFDGDPELVLWRPQEGGGYVALWTGQPVDRLSLEDYVALGGGAGERRRLRRPRRGGRLMETLEPGEERTTQRLMYIAGEAMRRMEREDPERFDRLRAAGGPVQWVHRHGDAVAVWSGEEIERLDADELHRVKTEDRPVIARPVMPAVPDDLSTLDALPPEPELPDKAEVERDLVALLRAFVADDGPAAERLLRGRDLGPLLMVMVANFVELGNEFWGSVRFADMLDAWRPGRKLSDDLLDET